MSDKPHFSPDDTYVLDESVIKSTEDDGFTGIIRDMDAALDGLEDDDEDPALFISDQQCDD